MVFFFSNALFIADSDVWGMAVFDPKIGIIQIVYKLNIHYFFGVSLPISYWVISDIKSKQNYDSKLIPISIAYQS